MNPGENKHVLRHYVSLHGASVVPQLSLSPPTLWRGRPGHPRPLFQVQSALCIVTCSGEWAPVNICSPSPANHNRAPGEAPRRPQYYPKGIVGNLALRNKWGFLRKHGPWDGHFGHRAQVMSGQRLYVLLNIVRSWSS